MLAYPKSLLPKVLPRAPGGHLETPFSPSVFWGPTVADTLLAGLPRVHQSASGDAAGEPHGPPTMPKVPCFPFALVSPAEPCCLWDRGQKV